MKYCILLCMLALISCRKVDRSISENQINKQYHVSVNTFLSVKENNFQGGRLIAFKELKDNLDFSKLKNADYGNGDKMIMIELKNVIVDDYLKFETEIKIANSDNQNDETKKSLHKVAMAVFYSHDNVVFDGQVVELRSNIHSENFLRQNFHRIIKNEKIDFSGSISINTLYKKTSKSV